MTYHFVTNGGSDEHIEKVSDIQLGEEQDMTQGTDYNSNYSIFFNVHIKCVSSDSPTPSFSGCSVP